MKVVVLTRVINLELITVVEGVAVNEDEDIVDLLVVDRAEVKQPASSIIAIITMKT